MNTRNMITAFAFTALAAACTNGGKQLASGIDLANLDSTYLPGTDFYMYATGGWQKAHPLTAEYSRFGSFDQLQEDNNQRLRSLIDSVSAQENEKGSIEQKIADLYKSAMDSVNLNEHYWGILEPPNTSCKPVPPFTTTLFFTASLSCEKPPATAVNLRSPPVNSPPLTVTVFSLATPSSAKPPARLTES